MSTGYSRNAAAEWILETRRVLSYFGVDLQGIDMAVSALDLALELVRTALQAGATEEAEALCLKLLQSHPANAGVLSLLGSIYRKTGRLTAALETLAEALTLDRNNAEIYCEYGDALMARGRFDEATGAYREALALNPGCVEAHFGLGMTTKSKGDIRASVEHYRMVVELKPGSTEAHSNLGNSLYLLGELEAAVDCYRAALEIEPSASVHNNLGMALRELGHIQTALEYTNAALKLEPLAPDCHFNKAFLLLLSGDLRAGFTEYEWRLKTEEYAQVRKLSSSYWKGTSVKGKTILLHPEQGFGDTIQFIRYAPYLKARGARVVVECNADLGLLLSTCPGVDHVYVPKLLDRNSNGDSFRFEIPPPKFDLRAALMSLPHLFGTTLENIPSKVPYLSPPPSVNTALLEKLGQLRSAPKPIKVGLVWSAKDQFYWHAKRNISLNLLEPLLELPGVAYYSLYKGPKVAELQGYKDKITDLGSIFEDFGDTANAIAQMDLVITVDTSVAHLSGAMAKPTWVMLPYVPDWRWLLDREDSPWYPTMRLFRQPQMRDWESVIRNVAVALRMMLTSNNI